MAEIIFHGSNVEVAEPKFYRMDFIRILVMAFTAQNTKNRQSVGLFQAEENLF